MEAKQLSLIDVLTQERLREVGEEIAALPDGREFEKKVQNDLWRKFTGFDDPPNSVSWGELPEESKSVIGYMDEEEGEVPWWLESFNWGASSRGEKLSDLGNCPQYETDALEKFSGFDTQATQIHKPELEETDLKIALSYFDKLCESIDEHVDLGTDTEEESVFPEDIFNINDGSMETTNEYRKWFNSVLSLCPPFSEEMTSLLLVNSDIKIEVVDDIFPDDLLANLEQVGIIDDLGDTSGKIGSSEYYKPLNKLLMKVGNTFDIRIDEKFDYSISIHSLEPIFYISWAQGYQGDIETARKYLEEASEYDPNKLEEGDVIEFATIAFDTPIRLQYRKPGYTTLSINSPYSDNAGYTHTLDARNRKKLIDEIMQSEGYIE